MKHPNSRTPVQPHLQNWKSHLQNFFRKPAVDFLTGILIFISVGLTLLELSQSPGSPQESKLEIIQQFITGLFAIELSLRWSVTPAKQNFFKTYWLDLFAVLPLLQLVGFPPAIRLLRLLRILRLFTLLIHYTNLLPLMLRRRTPEYFRIVEFLLLTVIFGSIIILAFEHHKNPDIDTLEDAFWFSIYSLFAGEPIPDPLGSLGGRVITVLIMLMHMTLFVVFTGTVSAFMIEKLRSDNSGMELNQLTDHTIICGWNRKAEIIVREYKAAGKTKTLPVVVIAFVDDEHTIIEPTLRSDVRFLSDDFTKVTVLEKAGIRRAKTCIILSDKSYGRSEQDADARTILAALTAEKLNPNVYTCAELINREYASHLSLGNVNAYVVSQEHSAFLLAQVALNHGLMGVFSELLSYEGGNHFYRLAIQPEWVGKSFLELFVYLKQYHNAILIAVDRGQDQFYINPNDYNFQENDQLIVIAQQEVQFTVN